MEKSVRKSICSAAMTAFVFFIIISFSVSYLCVRMTGKRYQEAIASAALDFSETAIDADMAKEVYSTRNISDEYEVTLDDLKKYQSNNNKTITRISLVCFSNTKGTYIFDTEGEVLGAKLEYDHYLESVKAELINGRNTVSHYVDKSYEVFRPIRTIDDTLTGYIIVKLGEPIESDYFSLILGIFLSLLILATAFVFFLMMYINRRFFLPLQHVAETAEYIINADAESFIGSENALIFEKHRNDEIGRLGFALEKMFKDMTSGERNLNQAIYDANHDGMTHVYNKRFYHSMEEQFRTLSSICIIYFDVNNLKLMNDTLGHESGDYVIKRAAEYIRGLASEHDYCFRTGGDEFLMIMTECSYRSIDNIIDKLEKDCPYILNRDGDSVRCALSFGYSYSKGRYDYDDLLNQAEERMYAKKTELKKIMQMPDR